MKQIYCLITVVVLIPTLTALENEGQNPDTANCVALGGQRIKDSEIAKMAHCILTKTNLMTDKGTFNSNLLKERLRQSVHSDELVDKVVMMCTVEKETPLKSAFSGYKCLRYLVPWFPLD
ncbi:odorant binding protein C21 [Tribolium castaneum]|uniref:Odorant binding protein C21 n=1 Tax=Tribolium castaneum TaxID=7070 RepID=D6WRD1_TRICA|nr:PREDICTED: uncharacterized protein LOC100142067 [Tribolium castaneum]EFA07491.1 odorant binding protein C21 [Tribolium castaneum]|eukprot:XP_001813665.1 PREDICTED: uncharacterized protein LOC100142067 [Tribolium castaneum]